MSSEESARQSLISKLKSVYQIGLGDGISGGAQKVGMKRKGVKKVGIKAKKAGTKAGTKVGTKAKKAGTKAKKAGTKAKKAGTKAKKVGKALVGGVVVGGCCECMISGEGVKPARKPARKQPRKSAWLHRVKEYSMMHEIPYKSAMVALKGTQPDRY